MAAVIYNCKACKVGKRVEYPNRDQARGSWWRDGESGRGRIYPGVSWGGPIGSSPKLQGDGVCKCGARMAWGYLSAWVSPDTKCDARCEHARGFKCDCSCGGENHGAGWSAGFFTGLLMEAA